VISESLLKKLRGEGLSAAGWGISSCCCGSKEHLFGHWATDNCAAPPIAIAGQYAALNYKPQLFGFPCKWRFINVGTLNLLEMAVKMVSECLSVCVDADITDDVEELDEKSNVQVRLVTFSSFSYNRLVVCPMHCTAALDRI